MLGLILLTVMGVGAATMIGSDGDDQIDGEDEGIVEGDELDPIVEEVEPVVEEVDPIVEDELVGDTGATLVFDEETNVLSIEVGEDETGTLAVIRSGEDNSGGGCCRNVVDYELHVYLVPEGVDFPPSVLEVAENNPELNDGGSNVFVFWTDYLENTGATEIGGISLGGISAISDGDGSPGNLSNDINYDLEIEANRDFDAYSLDVDDSGYLFENESLLPVDIGEINVPLTEAQTGTATIVDEDGENTTDTHAFWTDVTGTDGDDTITVLPSSPTLNIFAGDGDDTIDVGTTSSYVEGGDGDDRIILGEDYRGIADGGSGDDTFVASPGSSGGEMTGGDGADNFVLEARQGGDGGGYAITDFATGTDQIIVELGDDFDGNWSIALETTAADNVIRISFPDRVGEPDYEDLVVNIHGPRNLTVDDIVIMNSLPLTA